ncbi:hypothetical protein BBJ29_006520 [Phytophthora kernoviae]|uniref:Uncharacterized protein n=1 Tax=Phytophthora kernoviae TaxID=325452 RepID=A0A3F2S1I8_9STRA|nr:hypothetical protein BBP00_00000977 [Phytophthora kernoviae]RLN68825.1 hypothetical protein BBJ29_006520 [Phytophthora kernoviae]
MMALDSVSEKLRSKHVRTLELLQKTLDENVELRERVAKLQKGTLHLGQGLPRSNLSSELEDEIERLKEEHNRKVKAIEEAASAKLAEQTRAVEELTTTNSKLKNNLVTLDVALRDARETLKSEREAWKGERAQLEATISDAMKTLPPASPRRINQPPVQVELEEEKTRQRLEVELEQSRQVCFIAESARASVETRLVEVTDEFERVSKEASSQNEQIGTLQIQLAAMHEQQRVMSEELKASRQRKERPTSAASTKLLLQQSALLAQLQDMEEHHAKLQAEYQALQDRTVKLQQQLANEIAERRADAAGAGIFAIHVDLKRENFQLRAQVEELKALQKRFLTTAKKKTMSFPAL